MQYTDNFFSGVKIEKKISRKKDIYNIFAKPLIVGTRLNRLTEAVLTSTHNLNFGSAIRKIGIPMDTPVLLYKSGVQGGILFMDMFS